MTINEKSSIAKKNVLLNWSIQYDHVFNMPEQIQGTFFGESDKIKNGDLLRIIDVEQLDLEKMEFKTKSGQSFFLFGKGNRRYEFDHDSILKMFMDEKNNENSE